MFQDKIYIILYILSQAPIRNDKVIQLKVKILMSVFIRTQDSEGGAGAQDDKHIFK